MIKVQNTVTIYEADGQECKGLDAPALEVESHWNDEQRVVLVLPSGKRYTVAAADLRVAVHNATNTGKFSIGGRL